MNKPKSVLRDAGLGVVVRLMGGLITSIEIVRPTGLLQFKAAPLVVVRRDHRKKSQPPKVQHVPEKVKAEPAEGDETPEPLETPVVTLIGGRSRKKAGLILVARRFEQKKVGRRGVYIDFAQKDLAEKEAAAVFTLLKTFKLKGKDADARLEAFLSEAKKFLCLEADRNC